MDLHLEYSPEGDIRLVGSANIHTVHELYDGLVAAFRSIRPETPIRLDLNGVVELDTAAVQTLIVFRRSAGQKRVTVVAQEATVEKMNALGLASGLFS